MLCRLGCCGYLLIIIIACSELAVEMLQDVAPRELGKIDMYWASEVSR